MSTSTLTHRPARAADADALARIYNAGIASKVATLETRPRTADDVHAWLSPRHPIVLVEQAGTPLAFARATAYSPRECYAGVADFSVYVAPEARRRGAGTLAMQALLAACTEAGFHKLVGRVFASNAASRALLARVGFREVGVHQRHGRLDGAWVDIVVVERLLPAAFAP